MKSVIAIVYACSIPITCNGARLNKINAYQSINTAFNIRPSIHGIME